MGGGAGGNFGKTKGSTLDAISNILAVASLIPGVESFTNAVSIPVDILRGDWLSGGLDVLGVIPVVGEAGDTLKLAKLSDKASDASKVTKIINKQKKGTPRSNRAQNRQTSDIAKRLKLTPKQQRELHDLIHGENLGYQEILDLAKNWFNK